MLGHVETYFEEVENIIKMMPMSDVRKLIGLLVETKWDRGRVFILGVGGSAANASHMANDLRKICEIEAYAPTDNVAELTARANDEGFDTIFTGYFNAVRLHPEDLILFLSVGGGSVDRRVSMCLVEALQYAKRFGARTAGIVGMHEGYVAHNAEVVVVIPRVHEKRVTPHAEAFQAVVWHCVVSHPSLQVNKTKW